MYAGTNGKLLPLYKEPTRSSERLGSLFPGDDVLAYGVAVNLDNIERGDVNHSGINHVSLCVLTCNALKDLNKSLLSIFYLYIFSGILSDYEDLLEYSLSS